MRKILRAAAPARPAVILAFLAATLPALAAGDDWDRSAPYAIGHTTMVLIDTSRNPDGSTPATTAGRPLYLHIWYPTSARPTQHTHYTWNNPVYNQNPGGSVYPGLPDTPASLSRAAPRRTRSLRALRSPTADSRCWWRRMDMRSPRRRTCPTRSSRSRAAATSWLRSSTRATTMSGIRPISWRTTSD